MPQRKTERDMVGRTVNRLVTCKLLNQLLRSRGRKSLKHWGYIKASSPKRGIQTATSEIHCTRMKKMWMLLLEEVGVNIRQKKAGDNPLPFLCLII